MGSKETVPGYLQPDADCNINNIIEMRNTFLKERKSKRLPLRFEITSPYTGTTLTDPITNQITPLFTKQQLDMRRKAEILQYKKNSTQGSQLTKAEKFSKLVSGPFQRRTRYDYPSSFNVTYSIGNINLASLQPGSIQQQIKDNVISLYSNGLTIPSENLSVFLTNNSIQVNVIDKVLSLSKEMVQNFINATLSNVTDYITEQTVDVFTISYSFNYNNTIYNVGECASDLYLPTPTTSSNVPGPIINLQYEKNVPLYNYSSVNNNALIEDTNEEKPWIFSSSNNIVALSNSPETLFTLSIGVTDNFFNLFNFSTPIKFFMNGYNTNLTPITEEIKIRSIYVTAVFADTSIPNLTYQINSSDFTSINSSFTIAETSSSEYFEIVQYLGMLNITNLRLSTQFGFVYQLKINFNINTDFQGRNNYNNVNIGVYMNTTDGLSTHTSNITPPASISTSHSAFSISSEY